METNYNNFNNGIGGGIISPELSAGKQGYAVGAVICDKTMVLDVGGDFTLDDHLPDMRKLIKVDVKPTSPTKFISGGSVQLGGGVEYLATYLGSDGEIYGASFPGEYAFTVPFDNSDAANGISVSASVYPDSAVSRVSGARRVNIRCRLAADVSVVGVNEVDGGTLTAYDDHVQRLVKKSAYCNRLFGSKDDLELVSEVDTSEDGVRYISSECRVFVESAEGGDGYVDCRGYASVKHLMSREGGEIYTVCEKIPFSEIVEIDKLHAGSPVCVNGRCADIGLDLGGGDDFGEGKLKAIMRICLDATAFEQNAIEYVKDVYSTRKECKVSKSTYRLPALLACKNGNMTFSGYNDLAQMGILSDRVSIVDVSGSARCDKAVWDDNKYVVSGKCRFGVMYFTEDASDTTVAECELPFRYEFDGNEGDITHRGCAVNVINPRARCDGERMQVDCELVISCFVLGENEIEIVDSVRMDGDSNMARRGFTVCYPTSEDTLWSIAKRYRALVKDTAKGNGMDCSGEPDEIYLPENVKYMIV